MAACPPHRPKEVCQSVTGCLGCRCTANKAKYGVWAAIGTNTEHHCVKVCGIHDAWPAQPEPLVGRWAQSARNCNGGWRWASTTPSTKPP
eukprot:11310804-Alexandrium_andersonii.AAC.1